MRASCTGVAARRFLVFFFLCRDSLGLRSMKLKVMKNATAHELPSSVNRSITAGELADVLGLSTERIRQLACAGVITPTGRARYHLPTSLRNYFQYKEREVRRICAQSALQSGLINAKAREIELRLSEKREKLVPRIDVEEWIATVSSIAKEELSDLPSRLSREGFNAGRLKKIVAASLSRIEERRRSVVHRLRSSRTR